MDDKKPKNKFDMTVDRDKAKIEYREGDLPSIEKPKRVIIAGNINAVLDFVQNRVKTKESLANIVYSYKDMNIVLVTNERFEKKGYTIESKLELADELKDLELFIGKGKPKMYTSKDLVQTIRFNKFLFAKPDECKSVVEEVSKLKVKIEGEYKNEISQRGDKAKSAQVKVSSNIPLDFTLECPIFKGQNPSKFKVDICFDERSGEIDFWLESEELANLIKTEGKLLIDGQITELKKTKIVVIQK